jgi:hypothetical protein
MRRPRGRPTSKEANYVGELQTDKLKVAAETAQAEKAVKEPQCDKAKESAPRPLIFRMDAED